MIEPPDHHTHNRPAEQAVLGTMIRNPSSIVRWRDRLTPDRYYIAAHRIVAETVYAMYDRGEHIDLLTVESALKASGRFEDVGADYLPTLHGQGGFSADHYAKIVIDRAGFRDYVHTVIEAVAQLRNPTGPTSELRDALIQRLESDAGQLRSDGVTIQESSRQVMENIDARRQGQRPACLPTGFPTLDDLLCGGLRNGGLTVLAARTSRGKTALALKFTRNICANGGSVCFFSLEQAHDEITERNLSALSKVSGRRLQAGDMDHALTERVLAAYGTVQSWRFIVDDRRNLTATQIVSAARRHIDKIGGDRVLVVVDYLSLIRAEDPRAMRYQQVGDTVRKLRAMAGTLRVPVLLLAQLNRTAEESELPEVHQIKESGDVEQDADAILLLHQECDTAGELTEDFRLLVAKQRNGPRGQVRLARSATTFDFAESESIPT
jgi:replicative DNA helicase